MHYKIARVLYLVFFFSNISSAFSQVLSLDTSNAKQEFWVDSIYQSLNEEERIGQLFMVAAFSNKPGKHEDQIESLIRKNNIGGIIFFQGGPVRQARLTNFYQSKSKVPLLIGMDAEWGLGMRLDRDSVLSFPKNMTLGAITDNSYIFDYGKELARQCRRIGVHINFAPVADINNNPSNPVIGVRSFGEDPEIVTEKSVMLVKGLQGGKVLANAKHFPGHGNSGTDSHLTLPVISQSKKQLKNVELYPYRKLIRDSVMSIMVGHLYVPAYDSTPNKASTLSRTIVTDLLKKEYKFSGLIFTDALNMKGVSSFYKPGDLEVLALQAGNDVLLYSEDVPVAIKKITKAINDNLLLEEDIKEKVKKILRAKYWAGLHNRQPVKVDKLYEDLNDHKAKSLQLALYSKAMTLVENKGKLLPLKVLDTCQIASLSIGSELGNPFQSMLDNYGRITHFSINKNLPIENVDTLIQQLKRYSIVIVGIHNTNSFNPKDYGISENTRILVELLTKNVKSIICLFGSPYALKYFKSSDHLICAFEDNSSTNSLAAQLIFGGIPADGKLPVTAGNFKAGHGLHFSPAVQRLSYAFPENAKMDSKTLSRIDTLMQRAIIDGVTPGGQIVVAKDGMVVYQKSFGFLSYDKKQPVSNFSIYDIASVSKVAGTLQAVMFLEERGLIDLDKKASFYLSDLKKTNKENLIIRDILTHQAGLTPFIPHWKRTLDSSGFMKSYYCTSLNDTFCREVIPGLYSLESMDDSLWKWSVESDLLKKPKKQKNYDYVYSDLGFYIMKRIVDKITNQPMNQFLQQNFYDPLGLTTMTYNPLLKYNSERIAPTEDDKVFRKGLIRGTVHDQGAALLGGVAGHAGIFSNANDLAILMQMNLNKGKYGGQRYFLPRTIEEFSKTQFPKNKNRRALGWDKPEPAGNGPTSEYASSNTFGHTGFTGTATWVDPDHSLVYVFLSNRVHPDANNNKLIKQSIRTKVQDYIYQAIVNYHE